MATNAPGWRDGQRKAAVRKRTQLRTKVEDKEHGMKPSMTSGQFIEQKAMKKFRGSV